MMSTQNLPDQPVRCPRCGYDQRGVISTWRDQCPLEGRCTECGLHLRWAEVFLPEKFVPLWCVEHASGSRWAILKAAVGTYVRSFRPWRFWTQMKMSDQLQRRRIAQYLLLLFSLVLLGYVVEQATVATLAWSSMQRDVNEHNVSVDRSIQAMQQYIASEENQLDPPEKQQWHQLQLQRLKGRKVTSMYPYLAMLLEAILQPWADASNSPGGFGSVVRYPPPNGIHDFVMDGPGATGYGANQHGMMAFMGTDSAVIRWLDYVAGFSIFAAGVLLLVPVLFVLLPISRRRAKVRWRHIGRVFAYSMYIPVTTALLVFGYILAVTVVGDSEWYGDIAALLPSLLMVVAATVWWIAAAGRYLRMPRAWLVIILLVIMSLLLTLTVLAYIWNSAPD